MKKVRLLVIAMLIGTLMMCPLYAAAETPEGITEIEYPPVYLDDENMARTVTGSTISFNQDTTTKASGRSTIYTAAVASYIKITVTLQQAPKGSSTYTNSSQASVTKTVYNTNYIVKSYTFNVSNTKDYRIKVVVKDKINGVVYTRTLYKKMT